MKEQKMKGVVQEDDYIILFLNSRKKWLIQVKKDKEIHTHAGFVNGESLIGKRILLLQNIHLPSQNDYILKHNSTGMIERIPF